MYILRYTWTTFDITGLLSYPQKLELILTFLQSADSFLKPFQILNES